MGCVISIHLKPKKWQMVVTCSDVTKNQITIFDFLWSKQVKEKSFSKALNSARNIEKFGAISVPNYSLY